MTNKNCVDLFDLAIGDAKDEMKAPGQEHILDRRALAPEIRRLSQLEPHKALWAIVLQWLVMFGAGWVAVYGGSVASYVLGAIVIMSRKHALGILMHDGGHYLLCRPRWLNDVISDLFLAFPMGVSTQLFRDYHARHHSGIGDHGYDSELLLKDRSGNWDMPMLPKKLLSVLLADITGMTSLSEWSGFVSVISPWDNLKRKGMGALLSMPALYLRFFAYYALLITLLTYFGLWVEFFLLWIIPSLTILALLTRVRMFGEHGGVESTHELNSTRTIEARWYERFFFAPCGINFHIEHHLFPSVPFYNLRLLHELLLREPVYQREAHLTSGYFGRGQGLFKELVTGA